MSCDSCEFGPNRYLVIMWESITSYSLNYTAFSNARVSNQDQFKLSIESSSTIIEVEPCRILIDITWITFNDIFLQV